MMDCGPACLRMIAEYYNKNFDVRQMKNISRISLEGSSMLDIMNAAKKIGIKCTGLEIRVNQLNALELPVILHWDKKHFVVLFEIKSGIYFIADPAEGILELDKSDFLSHWAKSETDRFSGTLLTLSVIS